MQVVPKSGPTVMPIGGVDGAASKAAAIAAFNQASATGNPVSNPTNLSVEELGAIQATKSVDVGLTPSNEDTTPAASEVTEKAKENPLSSQYAILARKEKALRAHMQKLNAEREAFKAEKASLEAKLSEKNQDVESRFISKDKLLESPFEVLNDLGVSYDQITNQALNQPSAEELRFKKLEREADVRFKKLSEEQELIKKTFEQRDQDQYEQAVSTIREEARELVESDPAYEAVKETGQSEEIVKLITRIYERDGKLLSVERAAQLVEQEIIDRALNLTKINKIKQRLSANASAQKQSEPAAKTSSPQMKTLTNSVSTTKPLSSRERAILAAKGQLTA